MKFQSNGLVVLGMLALLFMAFAPNAHATIELTLDDGQGHTAHIIEGQAGDTCGLAGCLMNSQVNFGIWKIDASTILTNHPGNPVVMDLGGSATANKSKAGGTLTITVTDTDFSPQSSAFDFLATANLPLASISTNNKAWGGANNTAFSPANLIGSAALTTLINTASIHQNYLSQSPYSVTLQVAITVGKNGGTMSFDNSLTATSVPEPAVVTMLGGLLLCTVSAIRRKARRA